MWLLCYSQPCVTTWQQLCPERPCATPAPHDFAILKLFLQPIRAVYQRWSMVNAPSNNKQISTLDDTRSTKRQSLRRLVFQTQLELLESLLRSVSATEIAEILYDKRCNFMTNVHINHYYSSVFNACFLLHSGCGGLLEPLSCPRAKADNWPVCRRAATFIYPFIHSYFFSSHHCVLFVVVLLYYSVACVVGVLPPLTLHLRFHPLGSGQEYWNTFKTRLDRISLVENTQSNS